MATTKTETKTVLAGQGGYNRLLKIVDEDGEVCFTIEGLDSRGKPCHFDFDSIATARRVYEILYP